MIDLLVTLSLLVGQCQAMSEGGVSFFSREDFPSSPSLSQLSSIYIKRKDNAQAEKERKIMGSEAFDKDHSSTLKLPLFSMSATMHSPERPGMLTSPIHTSASVPFRWEEEPGKPKPSTTLAIISNSKSDFSHKCLELPPRLLLMDANMTKMSSPTTVLEGPYMGRSSRFQTSSFRMSSECYGSFRGSLSPERDETGAWVLSKRVHKNDKGLFGSWRKKSLQSQKEIGGGSYVFPSSVDRESECSREAEGSRSSRSYAITRIKRTGSFTTMSRARPHFWTALYGGLKQVIVPWRSRKANKDGLLG